MIFLRLLIFLFFIFCSNSLFFAQDSPKKTTRELIHELAKLSPSKEKVDLFNQLGRDFRDKGFRDSSLIYAKKAKNLSERLQYEKGMTVAYLNLGVTYREMNVFSEAEKHLRLLLKISEKTGDEIGKGDGYDNFGHLFLAKEDTVKALENHLKSLEIRIKANDQYGIGNSNENIGYIYSSKHDFVHAVKYFEASLQNFQNLHDESRIALAAGNVGSQYYFIGNYQLALKHFYTSLKYYKSTKNLSGEIWTSNLIGNIYSDAGNYELALKSYKNALTISKEINEWWQTVESYILLGRSYMMMKNFPKAHAYLQKAKTLSVKMEDPLRVLISDFFIAETYREQKRVDLALKGFQLVYESALEQNSNQWKASSSERIGRLLYEKKKYSEAKKWLMTSLKLHQEMYMMRDLAANYLILSDVNKALGEYKEAYENHKEYVKYNNQVEKNDASKLAMKYEFKKKEEESRAEQEKKDALTDKEIRTKSIQRNTAIVGFTLMTLLVASLLYLFRLRSKKLAAERLNVELKRREIETVKETEKFKSRFLANISHEFRTPLTFINGHLELLKQNASKEDVVRYNEMENNGKRLLQLINHLLDLSKMESGQYELQFQNGNLLNEIQAHVQAFHSHALRLGIELTIEISESAKQQLNQKPFYYSSEALTTILVNLLSNALKFTPSSGTIYTSIDISENHLLISVADTGIGIPDNQLDKVFDRFYQVDSVNQRFQSGSGIGLAIVKELAIMHGGEVSVKNAPESGCVFSISLANMENHKDDSELNPVSTEEFVPLDLIEKSANREIEIETGTEELPLVLVVEDQEQLRKFICECLGDQYRYMEAENGIQGVEMAKEYLPDILISDVMMPEMNGVELCGELKNNDLTSHIPIILLTAKSDQEDKEVGLEIGADDYLTKPFSVAELKLRVRNILRLRQALRDKFVDGNIPLSNDLPELSQRDREFLQTLITATEGNLSNSQFGVNPLAEFANLSSSQLTRKLKSLIGQTPADFIRHIRLQKAIELLKNGMSISDVSWTVGFEDPSYFGKVFKKQFGVPPSEFEKIKTD
ncbi:tetratricopeptide repeat protein [Fluviicola taffensis]|uniref:histidine kinase n=1 Tax=Fluviicola taffensis (strain DSM 16823 / NCIMB 13979 / RW262) TaxID=755732 RepID=F2IFK7_FLUTR|nr:tetratricopeptide repeat protein [Fluviicola taffensis]AEA45721.1 integral membrane sensor hybrid histidine kinase [Fluviicola taffensis DSM 16823]